MEQTVLDVIQIYEEADLPPHASTLYQHIREFTINNVRNLNCLIDQLPDDEYHCVFNFIRYCNFLLTV